MMSCIRNDDIVEIPTIAELVSAQLADADCSSAFASARRPNTRFYVDTNGVLF